MINDNTSDITDNDIIVAFEIKSDCNPLAVYLSYEGLYDLRSEKPEKNTLTLH